MQTNEGPSEARYAAAISSLVPSPSRYMTYLGLVFENVELQGKSLLDVGGGDGVLSFYAAARGAERVVCIDPGADGSSPNIDQRFAMLAEKVGGPVTRLTDRFQDHDPAGSRYDIVLVHSAINHLDEDACARLPAPDAAATYREIFGSLRSLLKPGGHIIVSDAARKNFWGAIGLHNVFAPTIEWHIHQQPKTWDRFMTEAGFEPARIRWRAPSKLRKAGQLLLGNALGGYLTNSNFIMTARAGESR